MKAITVLQPFASLLAIGAKHFETRGWATTYRGHLCIHAGKKPYPGLFSIPTIRGVVMAFNASVADTLQNLPYGAIIAVGELAECWQVTANLFCGGDKYAVELTGDAGTREVRISDKDYLFGDYSLGRYVWDIADVKMLPEPIPCRGQQRLWTVPEDTARQIEWEVAK
jgi:hypothetical protein